MHFKKENTQQLLQHVQFENYADDESTAITKITLLRFSWFRAYIVLPLLSLLTCFVLPIKMYWSRQLYARMVFEVVEDGATHVYVKGKHSDEICALEGGMFEYRFIKFDSVNGVFVPLKFPSISFNRLKTNSWDPVWQSKFGPCQIDVPVVSIWSILLNQVLNPFYIFQVFSMAVFYWEDYIYYAICILVLSAISIIVTVYDTSKNNRSIRKLALFSTQVVLQNGHRTDSSFLKPGDVIQINTGLLPCDLVLIEGTVLVSESILTGESVPVIKQKVPSSDEVYEGQPIHTLFGGTNVIQSRSGLGLVTNTGFLTCKGALVRDILYPQKFNFKFYNDGIKFVAIMAFIAFVGFAIIFPIMWMQHASVDTLIDRSLNMIVICVPPALPAAMSCGMVFAIQRLKKQRIFCISPPRINLAGQITTFVFDKTGTLTQDGLNVFGFQEQEFFTKSEQLSSQFQEAMACCHAVSVVEGQLVGDPLDVEMFKASGWQLAQSPNVLGLVTKQNKQIQINKRYDFSSQLQRMSVVVESDHKLKIVVKGSPEKVRTLCTNVPQDFDKILSKFTNEGFRVIALAYKDIEDVMQERHIMESGLRYIGLLVLQNQLKPESKPVIQQLQRCNVKTIMATGDNLLTGVSVALKCGIAADCWLCDFEDGKLTWTKDNQILFKAPQEGQMAMTGAALDHILRDQSLSQSCLPRTRVFARMSPDDKAVLVKQLQVILQEQIGFCGDGANDCAALKAADAGISLSEAEASIAAPFTSQVQNVECVITLLREGRAALATSFQAFKFIELYALIQFFSVLLLIPIKCFLTDLQFLYIDLVALVPLSIFQARTGAYQKLTKDVPAATLFCTPVLVSVAGSAVIQLLFQVYFFFDVRRQPFYKPPELVGEEDIGGTNIISYEDTVLFLTSNFQYVVTAIALSVAKPFRQSIVSNKPFAISIVLIILANTYLLLARNPNVDDLNTNGDNVIANEFLLQPFYTKEEDYYSYRYKLLAGIILNTVVTITFEKLFIKRLTQYCQKKE